MLGCAPLSWLALSPVRNSDATYTSLTSRLTSISATSSPPHRSRMNMFFVTSSAAHGYPGPGHNPRFALVTAPFPPFPLIFYTHNKYYILVMSPTGPGALGTDESRVSEAAT
ncbi:hypothetical protein M404DRAFT_809253 [Pisolithus tinctorius Marx 270]|uniref:Uncharacterized protein n=1 Tax=Pisolithus tinctorius Marx 270 TaxID=870435 RepID=A0A0C3NW74_PISTI|nr:hypothetical protein M404DRAFT_809253 [Pisolithus tinctorius Marx 270]